MIRLESSRSDRLPAPAGEAVTGRVIVSYERSSDGRAALAHAVALARAAEAELIVVSVATQERVDVGCASCRHGAALWNRELREMAVSR